MAERLTFTLAGRDELSRVLNNTADASDRLRLRMAGITADADGRLRDLEGRFLTTEEAQRRVGDSSQQVRSRFDEMSKAAEKLGEKLKASLISLAPAAIPATAALAEAAGAVGVQLGAAALAAAAYGVALKPQLAAISDTAKAQAKYESAVSSSGAASQKAIQAQVAYQQQLNAMPAATQKAALAVGLLQDDFQAWSDSLAGDVMGPFTKGVAVADALLPKTTGLVKGASAQFDRLITMVGGAISTPGFDKLTTKITAFSDEVLDHAVDELTIFLAKLDGDQGQIGGGVEKFLDYARANGPAVWETLQNVGDALLNILQAGSDVGVGMLDVVNALSGIVAAVPPEAIATLLQLAIAIKGVKLASAGADAAKAALLAIATQVAAMNGAAAAAPGRLAAVTAAIGSMSRGAKLAAAGAGLGLLLVAVTALSSAGKKTAPDVDKMTTAISHLGDTGKVTGELAKTFGNDLDRLGYSVDRLAGKSGGMDAFNDAMNAIFTLGMKDSNSFNDAKADIDALDKSLASLVNNGNAKLAKAALDNLTKNLKPGQAKELRGELDDYKDALAGAALEQKLTAESMGLFGEQAQKTQAKLDEQKNSADGLRQSIQALNDVNRKGLGGMIGFEAAIDAASKAARENAGALTMSHGQLDLNSEKARTAASALQDLADKTDSAAASARESGSDWETVNGIYARGRSELIKSAEAMGLTAEQARALADQILQIPDKTAKVKMNTEDATRDLDNFNAEVKRSPGSKSVTLKTLSSSAEQVLEAFGYKVTHLKNGKVTVTAKTGGALTGIRDVANAVKALHDKSITITTTHKTFYSSGSKDSGGIPVAHRDYATGGRVRGYAVGGSIQAFPDGGFVQGPGTATSDSILALFGSGAIGRVSDTEFVVNAKATREHLPLLEAINSGRLPMGKAAPRAGLPAAPAAAVVGAGSDRPAVTYNVYPRASVIGVEDLRLIQRQEEARQRVGRPR
ncbi:hypothetical protein [Streptomyces murinus]|uniref:hypothetical protein n=1 Tax=Streptomyces murinus TaxID=33900 RepID=UPI002E136EAC|nr:hypothetical protein OG516_19360 [Streptomyces murinus]